MIDLQHIQSEINLAIRLSRGRTLNGREITASTLQNPEAIHQIVRNQVAYKFLQNILGSPPYWQHELHDVLAMLRCIGIPTWFLTLSTSRLTLAQNDPGYCITNWKENFTERSFANVYGTKEQLSSTKPCYRNSHVSTQG